MTDKKKSNKRNKGGKGKATNAESESRVLKTMELYLLGLKAEDIHEYFITNLKIKVSLASVRSYITKAREKIKNYSEFKTNEEIGKSILRMEKLYLNSYRIQDYKTCLQVQKELNKLLGLITEKHDLTSDGKPIAVPQTVFNILESNPKKKKEKK